MNNKDYKSINEVSELLDLKKHVIRYWDSRFDGISTRIGNRTRRFFSESNIQKLKDLKNTLYTNGKSHNSFDLANKLINKVKSEEDFIEINKHNSSKKNDSFKELNEISVNLKKILNSLNI